MTIFGNRNQEMPDGLDPWVEGRNDPDHPFNREDEESEPEPEICRPCLGTRQECWECLECD